MFVTLNVTGSDARQISLQGPELFSWEPPLLSLAERDGLVIVTDSQEVFVADDCGFIAQGEQHVAGLRIIDCKQAPDTQSRRELRLAVFAGGAKKVRSIATAVRPPSEHTKSSIWDQLGARQLIGTPNQADTGFTTGTVRLA